MKTSIQRQLSVLALIALAPLTLALMKLAHAAPPVTVTAAEPSSAEQGTLALDVAVTGSGFDSTAAVNFLVAGTTNPGGVTVKKVTFNSSKKLTATIDVADSAAVNKFDIEVVLSQGRKGKGTSLFSVAKKAGPAPVQVPPPGSCSGAPGVFPAFAYTKDRWRMSRRNRVYDGSDIYLANSTGSCSVLVAIDTYIFGGVSYRQIGSEARIVWSQFSTIKLMKFQVDQGNVVPTAPSIVYSMNYNPSGITDVELSKDGLTIYFGNEFETPEGQWVDTLNSVSIASCSTNCTPQNLITLDDSGIGGLSINPENDRLYMSIHHRVPDIRTISFLEKQAGIWSSALRHVVTDQDAIYATVSGLAETAFGEWDYDGTGIRKKVLAVHVERTSGDTIDVLDVTRCGIGGPQSCFASGQITLIRSGIDGGHVDFTSMPAAGDPAPNLLVSKGNFRDLSDLTSEVDLDSMTVTPLLQGVYPDSAD